MGIFSRRKARKEANQRIQDARYASQRLSGNTYANGLDPASTALLLSTVHSDHGHNHESLDSDDNYAVDSYESESDRYVAPDTSSDYGTTYTAPTYDFSTPSYDSGSSSSSSYSSSDSGSSYSSSDSGSSFSSSD